MLHAYVGEGLILESSQNTAVRKDLHLLASFKHFVPSTDDMTAKNNTNSTVWDYTPNEMFCTLGSEF